MGRSCARVMRDDTLCSPFRLYTTLLSTVLLPAGNRPRDGLHGCPDGLHGQQRLIGVDSLAWQDQLLPPVNSTNRAPPTPTPILGTPSSWRRASTSNTPQDALPVAARLYTGLALAFTPAGLSLLKPSHHASPSCRSGSPTSMSHRYGLADTWTPHCSAQTVLYHALPQPF